MTEIKKNFNLPELGRRIEELVNASGPLWDIVYTRVQAALDQIEEQVAVRTPVGATGNLRGGWGTVPLQLHGVGVMYGQVVNPMSYGPVVEEGRQPGTMPPITPGLKLWVKRVLGVPDKDVDSVSFAVAKKIEARGTKPARMLDEGWRAAFPVIDQQMSAMLTEIVAELGDSIMQ